MLSGCVSNGSNISCLNALGNATFQSHSLQTAEQSNYPRGTPIHCTGGCVLVAPTVEFKQGRGQEVLRHECSTGL